MNVKNVVNGIVDKYGTRNPYELCDLMGIEVEWHHLIDVNGYSFEVFGVQQIILNDTLDESTERYVLAHEIGHTVMHSGFNGAYLMYCTGLAVNKIEKEADAFAAELLITDEFLLENRDMTVGQLAQLTGYSELLLELKRNT